MRLEGGGGEVGQPNLVQALGKDDPCLILPFFTFSLNFTIADCNSCQVTLQILELLECLIYLDSSVQHRHIK